jgi:hypothetical protein
LVTCGVPLRGPVAETEELLRGDPFGWLPDPVLEHGVHEFRCTVRPWWFGVIVMCTLSGPWVRGDVIARGVRLDPSGTFISALVRDVRGDLTVSPAPSSDGAVLTFEGRWIPGPLRWGRPVAHRVVATFLREIAGRLQEGLRDG